MAKSGGKYVCSLCGKECLDLHMLTEHVRNHPKLSEQDEIPQSACLPEKQVQLSCSPWTQTNPEVILLDSDEDSPSPALEKPVNARLSSSEPVPLSSVKSEMSGKDVPVELPETVKEELPQSAISQKLGNVCVRHNTTPDKIATSVEAHNDDANLTFIKKEPSEAEGDNSALSCRRRSKSSDKTPVIILDSEDELPEEDVSPSEVKINSKKSPSKDKFAPDSSGIRKNVNKSLRETLLKKQTDKKSNLPIVDKEPSSPDLAVSMESDSNEPTEGAADSDYDDTFGPNTDLPTGVTLPAKELGQTSSSSIPGASGLSNTVEKAVAGMNVSKLTLPGDLSSQLANIRGNSSAKVCKTNIAKKKTTKTTPKKKKVPTATLR